ncbi:hypothetical protein WDH52_09815 [Streptomyces sp. TRM70308]|uniref:hypothetical protein n=1 Tax=Streptomyces TaxID=1883 RepID=UPI0022489D19|nr:hypothetical protein [Streptomyces sp. JHD 1]MCX2969175.1 hypothetical protein [Streptomyces sp. JHD 1]
MSAPGHYSSEGPPDPKLEPVRRALDAPHPVAPPGLAAAAAQRGRRLLRRRRAARRLGWAVLALAVVALAVWGSTVQPWQPADTITPPGLGW